MSLWNELKRRNVIRVAVAYVVAAWLIIQVAETILPLYNVPESSIRMIVTVLATVFIPVVILAWALEWTPEGIKRDANRTVDEPILVDGHRRFDRIVIIVLAVAVTYFAVDEFVIEADPVQRVEQSIAVLPFSNLSPDPEQAFLALGMAEEVRNLLAKVPVLRVISRTAVSAVIKGEPEMSQLATKLNVAHVVEGSVQTMGNRIRVSAQLVEVTNDTQLWSETYDRTLDDIFEIQDEIAENIVNKLQVELVGPMPTARRTDPQALHSLIKAKQVWYQQVLMGNWAGVGEEMDFYLDKALEFDPTYVEAISWRGMSTWALAAAGEITPDEYNRRNALFAQAVRSLDPEHAFAYWVEAWRLAYFELDFAAAAPIWEKVYKGARNNSEILRDVARFASFIERFDISTKLYERAIAVDPLCTRCLYHISRNFMYAGQWEQARKARERFMLLEGNAGSYFYGIIKIMLGDAEHALEIFQESDSSATRAGRVMALHALGRHDESDLAMSDLINEVGDSDPRLLAEVHAFRSENDAAFRWLEKLLLIPPHPINGSYQVIDTVMSPMLQNLHGDPRWEQFRIRAGMPTELIRSLQFTIDDPA